jgi:hypothetical protein
MQLFLSAPLSHPLIIIKIPKSQCPNDENIKTGVSAKMLCRTKMSSLSYLKIKTVTFIPLQRTGHSAAFP